MGETELEAATVAWIDAAADAQWIAYLMKQDSSVKVRNAAGHVIAAVDRLQTARSEATP